MVVSEGEKIEKNWAAMEGVGQRIFWEEEEKR